MKKLIYFLLLVLPLGPLSAAPTSQLTLKEAYQRALKQSESVAFQALNIELAEAHYQKALSTVLPHLEGNVTETIQDGTSNGSGVNSFNNRFRNQTSITLTQPLFQGLREFRAMGMANVEKNLYRQQLTQARHQLFYDVTRAYYLVLKLERERSLILSVIQSLKTRQAELNERLNLGKSRESEVLVTEAELASKQAELENLKGTIQTSRDYLGFLTGTQVTEKLVDQFDVPKKIEPLASLMNRVLERPDVLASQSSTKLAKGNVKYTEGALLPHLGMSANYYAYRSGIQKDVDWDMNLALNVPIFKGGATRGSINEAKVELKQAKLEEDELFRQAQLELQQAYHHLMAAKKRESTSSVAASKSQRSYDSLLGEYQNNLVDNLEIIESLKMWHEKRLDYNEAHYQTKLYYLELLVSSNQVPFQEDFQ